MTEMNAKGLTIYDPLYGRIELPGWLGDILRCPELQRLREVRLFNSSAWTLTGSAGVSRFEHAIGTAHLAVLNCTARGIDLSSQQSHTLILAALIHDIATAAFGHTIERVLAPLGFSHINVLKALHNDYRLVSDEPYFAGAPPRLARCVEYNVLATALDAVVGSGPMGQLIANDLDLDNMDNVVRGAMYLGLGSAPDLATDLARAQLLTDGEATVKGQADHLINRWQGLRSSLYDLLFDSSEQVASEAMIFDAGRRMVRAGSLTLADWRLTDHELLERFEEEGDSHVKRIARDIRLGRTYPIVHEFCAPNVERKDIPDDESFDSEVADWKQKFFYCDLVYLKRDFGQSRRAVLRRDENGRRIRFGADSNRVTVTILSRRSDVDARHIRQEHEEIGHALAETLRCDVLSAPDLTVTASAPLTLWQD